MAYTHQHIPVLDTPEGYDLLGQHYQQYHDTLTQRDKTSIEKCLPRSLRDLEILDIGWGDGRRAKLLQPAGATHRTILDGSSSLLKAAPSRTVRLQGDLLEPFPLADSSFHLLLCTFVLLHLPSLENVFSEARRVVKPSGRMLVLHHYERRPWVHMVNEKPFKIRTRHRSFDQVHEQLLAAGREVDLFEVDEMTRLYCCFPYLPEATSEKKIA